MSIERADPNVWDTDDAKSHPVWYSTLFEVKARRFIMSWVNDLELHTVGDTVQRDGSNYTQREILEYFEEHFEQTDDGTAFLTSDGGVLKRIDAARAWQAITNAIPSVIRDAARGTLTEIER